VNPSASDAQSNLSVVVLGQVDVHDVELVPGGGTDLALDVGRRVVVPPHVEHEAAVAHVRPVPGLTLGQRAVPLHQLLDGLLGIERAGGVSPGNRHGVADAQRVALGRQAARAEPDRDVATMGRVTADDGQVDIRDAAQVVGERARVGEQRRVGDDDARQQPELELPGAAGPLLQAGHHVGRLVGRRGLGARRGGCHRKPRRECDHC